MTSIEEKKSVKKMEHRRKHTENCFSFHVTLKEKLSYSHVHLLYFIFLSHFFLSVILFLDQFVSKNNNRFARFIYKLTWLFSSSSCFMCKFTTVSLSLSTFCDSFLSFFYHHKIVKFFLLSYSRLKLCNAACRVLFFKLFRYFQNEIFLLRMKIL